MKEIPLTKGLVAIVDDEDFELVSAFKWYASGIPRDPTIFYAKTHEKGTHRSITLHRMLMGEPVGIHVDHVNGNPLDCRRPNLRVATSHQNSFNRWKDKNRKRPPSSRYKGVSIHRRVNSIAWAAQIKLNQEQIYLGLYPTEEMAARAYDGAAVELFGEFARLNFSSNSCLLSEGHAQT